MRVAIYARVSTENQETRGTIGSQLAVLRARVANEGQELVAEFCDEGYSGARLDRPGLDALRDAAEAGVIEAVWCLSPDRLARKYAYQVIVLDELDRHGVHVLFTDAPALDDDPQARLLVQVQGVIAEYERAKIAERYRRGKLWRARRGEVIFWKVPYGYRRIAGTANSMAQLVVYEPEAAVVRRIFEDYMAGHSTREIVRRLNLDHVPSPTGKAVWGTSTIGRLLRNESYRGRAYYNRTESIPDARARRRTRQVLRAREQWIAIDIPRIVTDELFEAAKQVSRDNSQWSPRRIHDEAWLLRHVLKCGHCGVAVSCHRMRGRNGAYNRYYYCHNHDPVRARGEHRRCPERNIRADALDTFVFEQLRAVLERPDLLLAAERAVSARTPAADDELLRAQLKRLERRVEAAGGERRRLVDLYQGGLLELAEVQDRAKEIDARREALEQQRRALIEQRGVLVQQNRLRHRIAGFAHRVRGALYDLGFEQCQKLVRLMVEEVRVAGHHVDIRLQIPLDQSPGDTPSDPSSSSPSNGARVMSSNDRLRSFDSENMGVMSQPIEQRSGKLFGGKDLNPLGERQIGSDDGRAPLIALG
jgi:site-specific DNA recombinase